MEREFESKWSQLQAQGIEAYDMLQIDRSASTSQIKRAYKLLALKLHPDKSDPSSAAEFSLLNICYQILVNEEFRSWYNERTNIAGGAQRQKVVNSDADLASKLAQLHQEYEELRQRHAAPPDNGTVVPTTVTLKWKNKQPIDSQTIKTLMSVFGHVTNVKFQARFDQEGYRFARVGFKTSIGASLACAHNYAQTSDIWNHLNLRKISSLLRSAEFDSDFIFNFKQTSNANDYISLSVLAYR